MTTKTERPANGPEKSPADRWADAILDAIEDARTRACARIWELMSAIPTDNPAELAPALHRIWLALIGSGPLPDWGSQIYSASSAAGRRAGDNFERAFSHVAGAVLSSLKELFAEGHNDPTAPVIATGTIPRDALRGGHGNCVAIPLAALPPDHPARPVVTPTALNESPSGPVPFGSHRLPGPLVIVGLPNAPWWEASAAAALTAPVEDKRRSEEAEYRRLEEVEKENRRRAWEATPAGQAEALRRRVEELESQLAAK